jgi:hypothetical protein
MMINTQAFYISGFSLTLMMINTLDYNTIMFFFETDYGKGTSSVH